MLSILTLFFLSDWQSTTTTDRMTDEAMTVVSKQSTNGDATFCIRCTNGKLAIFIKWPFYIGSGDIRVMHRQDSDKATDNLWAASVDGESTFMQTGRINFSRRLISTKTLLIRITPPNGEQTTVEFSVENVRPLLEDFKGNCRNFFDPPKKANLEPFEDLMNVSFLHIAAESEAYASRNGTTLAEGWYGWDVVQFHKQDGLQALILRPVFVNPTVNQVINWFNGSGADVTLTDFKSTGEQATLAAANISDGVIYVYTIKTDGLYATEASFSRSPAKGR